MCKPRGRHLLDLLRLKIPRINGYRGTFQILFGGAYIFIGRSYLGPPSEYREDSLHWFTEILPMSSLGWLWIICGVVALVGGFMARPRDGVSFAALAFAPVVLCVLNAIGFITGYNDRGWEIAAMYLFVSGTAFTVAGMQGDADQDKRVIA